MDFNQFTHIFAPPSCTMFLHLLFTIPTCFGHIWWQSSGVTILLHVCSPYCYLSRITGRQ